MKTLVNKTYDILSSTQPKILASKLACLAVLFFLGCLWQPAFLLVTAIAVLFIVCEHDINSILYILFFVPLLSLFTFNNSYGLNYWFLLVCGFVFEHGIMLIYNLIKKREKLNYSLLIILGVLAVYFTIPFSNKYSIISVLESYVWLALFYLIFSKIKRISVNCQAVIASAGFIFSGFVGLFRNIIPYIKENIYLSSGGELLRFSGAMSNPNAFYCWGVVCLSLLIVLMANKKLSLWYSLLAGVVLALCYVALSKTFLVIYLIMLAVMVAFCFIKKDKTKTKAVAIMLVLTLITAGIFFNYTKSYYDRFFNTPEIPMDTILQTGGRPGGIGNNSNVQDVINTVSTGRLEIWQTYFNDIKENNKFIFGFGVNTAYGLLQENTHNTYLQVLYELGVVGYLLIIGIGIYYLKKSRFKIFKNLGTMSFLPVLVSACNYITENLFLSQMGNMLFLLACFGLLMLEEDSYDNTEKREVLTRLNTSTEKEDNDFKLAILTPAYNRPELLKNAYNSLKNQTCKDFVWYVVDDGSTTPQAPEVNRFKVEGVLDIKLIVKENGGKHTAINEGLKNITEPAVMILDNDDWLIPTTVETIKRDWDLIKTRQDICGIGYLKMQPNNTVVGEKYTKDGVVDNFVNERYNNNAWGDKAEVFKTDILKQFSFPVFKGENFLSESIVWSKMSMHYKMVFFNDPIYVCEYLDDGLSNGVHKRLFKNPLGATECYKELTTKQFNLTTKIKYTLLYILYSFAGEYSLKNIVVNSYNKVLTAMLLPFGYALYLIRKRRFS